MKAYCISGLGADYRVYEALDLAYEMVHLAWIPPLPKESLSNYAARLGATVGLGIEKAQEPFVLIGVSFGGLIAVEMASFCSPQQVVLISSIATPQELPRWYRWIGKTKLIPLLPTICFQLPFGIAKWVFGTKNPLLQAILKDSDPAFTQWAIQALLTWDNGTSPSNSLVISGDKDLLLSSKQPHYVIKGGHHFMIVDRAEEISVVINENRPF